VHVEWWQDLAAFLHRFLCAPCSQSDSDKAAGARAQHVSGSGGRCCVGCRPRVPCCQGADVWQPPRWVVLPCTHPPLFWAATAVNSEPVWHVCLIVVGSATACRRGSGRGAGWCRGGAQPQAARAIQREHVQVGSSDAGACFIFTRDENAQGLDVRQVPRPRSACRKWTRDG
jgi:hypothetical protein